MNNDTLPRVSAVILAGGQSRRMGFDKAFLDFEGEPLIARVLAVLRTLSDDIIIVANDAEAYGRFGVRVVGDIYPGRGSLGGLYSALVAAREPYTLAVACDMPLLNADLLRYLISLAPGYDIVIPRSPDPSSKAPRFRTAGAVKRERDPLLNRDPAKWLDLHPMHAVYARTCLAPIEARLQSDDLRLIGFQDDVRVRVVEQDEVDRLDPKHWSFFNANTPEDLDLARRIIASGERGQGQQHV